MRLAFPIHGPAFAIAGLLALGACTSTQSAAPSALPPATASTSAPAPAKPENPPIDMASFDNWLAGFRGEAAAAGISAPTIQAALSNLQPMPDVLAQENTQPEVKLTYAQYLSRTVTDQRAAQGRKLLAQYRPLLDRVSAAYGVQAQYIVALWGVESDYGRVTGGYPVIAALATLAYGSQRKDMFHIELIAALKILDEHDITPDAMTGSWAGAMGQCQFLPSSFLHYAVDFSGNGRRDIWTDQADVFGSIANYLHNYGWFATQSWGRAVQLPPGLDENLISWKTPRPVSDWQKLGLRNADGSTLVDPGVPLALVASDGVTGPAYLVTPNFGVVMKWNRSTYFATSVGLLADRIAGG
jgi:membrane-bound lytic murein transglycosylase B